MTAILRSALNGAAAALARLLARPCARRANPDGDTIRTLRLRAGRTLRLPDAAATRIRCCAGTVWITQENDPRDIFLAPGDCFTLDRPGVALVRAESGMADEWAADTGLVVVCLERKPC